MDAMLAEVISIKAEDVPGEIFCLQAMFPAYAGENELDPLMLFK